MLEIVYVFMCLLQHVGEWQTASVHASLAHKVRVRLQRSIENALGDLLPKTSHLCRSVNLDQIFAKGNKSSEIPNNPSLFLSKMSQSPLLIDCSRLSVSIELYA